jgi:hypothetical protein
MAHDPRRSEESLRGPQIGRAVQLEHRQF